MLAATTETIDHASLARLIEAGAVRGADVIGSSNGWGVVVRYGTTARTLAARRGSARTFRKFETLVSYLKELGISQYHVDAAGFDPEALKADRARPDASERMRSAFEARAHTHWLREKTSGSLADTRPNLSHAQVMADAQALIDAKRKQRADKAAS